MNAENKQAILDELDATLRAIGQKDYEQFRSLLETAAILCENIAVWSRRYSALTRKELEDAIEKLPDAEAATKLALATELRNYLPTLGTTFITAATRVFPRQVGGAHHKLGDRDAMRQACTLVLGLIADGKAEPEAKKIAAKQLNIGLQTMSRTWARRTIIMQPSIEEFLGQLFKSFATAITSSIPQGDDSLPKSPEDHTQGLTEPIAQRNRKKRGHSGE